MRKGQPAPSPPAWDLQGSPVSSPAGSEADLAPAAKRFSRILNTQDDLLGQQDYGPLAKRTVLASWPSGRARGRARTKMVGPMALPCL